MSKIQLPLSVIQSSLFQSSLVFGDFHLLSRRIVDGGLWHLNMKKCKHLNVSYQIFGEKAGAQKCECWIKNDFTPLHLAYCVVMILDLN